MKIIVAAVFILVAAGAAAQTSKFSWGTESCSYESTFDSTKVSREKLKDTYTLWFSNYGYLETDATAFKLKEIGRFNVDTLEKEYRAKLVEIKNFKLLPHAYWDSLRTIYITELMDVYELKKVTILAYKDPKVLLGFKRVDSIAKKYARILNSTNEEIINGWDMLLEEECKQNGFPEKLRAEHARMRSSAESIQYAKMELMTFGWWNAANHCVRHVNENDSRSEDLFKSAFITTKTIECEDRD